MPLILTEADIMVLQGQLANKAWLLFCFILVSCSEPKDSLVVNFLSPDLDLSKNIVLYKNAPLSGVVYGLSSNALDTLWLRYYKEGLKSGVWKQYYPGGELKETRKFVKNKKEGNYRGYYKGGLEILFFNLIMVNIMEQIKFGLREVFLLKRLILNPDTSQVFKKHGILTERSSLII